MKNMKIRTSHIFDEKMIIHLIDELCHVNETNKIHCIMLLIVCS
jgi:hypothetical protein